MLTPRPNEQPDINEQLGSLRESDVKVTFTDIWRDYKNYRTAYYFVESEKLQKDLKNEPGTDEKGEVPVNIDNFSFRKYIKFVYKHSESHEKNTFPSLVIALSTLTIFIFSARLGFEIKGLIYDYKDPLIRDEEDVID